MLRPSSLRLDCSSRKRNIERDRHTERGRAHLSIVRSSARRADRAGACASSAAARVGASAAGKSAAVDRFIPGSTRSRRNRIELVSWTGFKCPSGKCSAGERSAGERGNASSHTSQGSAGQTTVCRAEHRECGAQPEVATAALPADAKQDQERQQLQQKQDQQHQRQAGQKTDEVGKQRLEQQHQQQTQKLQQKHTQQEQKMQEKIQPAASKHG